MPAVRVSAARSPCRVHVLHRHGQAKAAPRGGFHNLGGSYGAADEDVALLVEGRFMKPFLRLDNVFMNITRKPKGEWDEEKKYLMRWGHGERGNYVGHMFTRADRIVHITPLKEMALRDGSKEEEE